MRHIFTQRLENMSIWCTFAYNFLCKDLVTVKAMVFTGSCLYLLQPNRNVSCSSSIDFYTKINVKLKYYRFEEALTIPNTNIVPIGYTNLG